MFNNNQLNIQTRIAQAIASGQRVRLISDFDGALSPFTDQPDQAYFDPEAEKGFFDLVARDEVEGAILTGREVAFMTGITNGEVDIIGSHGVEYLGTDGTQRAHQFSDVEQELIQSVKDCIRSLAAHNEGKIAVELEKSGCVSAKTDDINLLQAARDIISQGVAAQENHLRTFVMALESDQEVEMRPNEDVFGKGYGIDNFIQPAPDDLVIFIGDSFKAESGTDVSAAVNVRARGDNGIVIRVDNGRVTAEDISEDATPHVTYDSPAHLGMALQQINHIVLSMQRTPSYDLM